MTGGDERRPSAHVMGIHWDPATRVLEVEYRGGRRYQYADVDYDTWAELQRAESKGSFLRRVIQRNHSVKAAE